MTKKVFVFEPSDVDKFIVVKLRYQQNLFWGSLLGTQLAINDYHLTEKDKIYGVYEIGWHSDWLKKENNMSYKVNLKPVGEWGAWCPNTSWYTSDMEHIINEQYNLNNEIPLFDDPDEATKFAIDKNYEMFNEMNKVNK